MMRLLRCTLLLGLLVMASACGTPNNSSGSGAGNTGESGGAVASTALPRPTSPPSGVNPAQADGRVVDLRPVRWSNVVPGADGQLAVYYTVSGLPACGLLGRVAVVETSTSVTVTVLVGRLPGTDCSGAQPMLAAAYRTVVTLRAPLGTRATHDGAA